VTAVADRFTHRPWRSLAQPAGAGAGRGLLRSVGRLTNPDGLSRWVMHRLERLPDVAEII
jgi:hypothetical protein